MTTAPAPHREDIDQRIRRYLLTMSVRTVCFLAMIFVDGWLRWACAALAVFLPYVAVVFANARRPRVAGRVAPVIPRPDDARHLGR